MLKKQFKRILIESDAAFKELSNLIADDKDSKKYIKKGNLEFLDYVYTKYEKYIESIIKRYKLDYDDIADLILKIVKVK